MTKVGNWTHFAKDERGAVTVDWVVLSAAIVGMGVSTVTAVRTGTLQLGTNVESSLSSASVSLPNLQGFTFSFHNELQQSRVLERFRGRNDRQVSWNSVGLTRRFEDALAAGDYEAAQKWLERRSMNQMVLDERGLVARENSMTVSEMQAQLAAAQ